MILGYIFAFVMIVLDQVTKLLIFGDPAKSIIGNLLWFESSFNTGVAFSLFEGNSAVFIITSLLASGVFIYIIASKKFFTSKFEKISIGLVLGGTLSNAIDRCIFGGVRDFIYLKFMNFAIFNVADMAITIGAVLLCVSLVIGVFKKEPKNETEKKEEKW